MFIKTLYILIPISILSQKINAAAFPGITAAPIRRSQEVPGYVIGYYPDGTNCTKFSQCMFDIH
jgi:hypothetical protein